MMDRMKILAAVSEVLSILVLRLSHKSDVRVNDLTQRERQGASRRFFRSDRRLAPCRSLKYGL
jgi:hypothetical protein